MEKALAHETQAGLIGSASSVYDLLHTHIPVQVFG